MTSYQEREFGLITASETADALARLTELIEACLPLTFTRDEGLWPPVGHGLVARVAEIARSITVLLRSGCNLDAVVMARVLYEHVIVFSWLAADPDDRIPLWIESGLAHQRSLHFDAQHFGRQVLSDAEIAESRGTRKLRLRDLVGAVDDYWSNVLPGFHKLAKDPTPFDFLTLEGLYVGLFRVASRAVHAQGGTLATVMQPLEHGRSVVSGPSAYERHTVVAMSVPLVTMTSIVGHHCFGRPDAQAALLVNRDFLYVREEDQEDSDRGKEPGRREP